MFVIEAMIMSVVVIMVVRMRVTAIAIMSMVVVMVVPMVVCMRVLAIAIVKTLGHVTHLQFGQGRQPPWVRTR